MKYLTELRKLLEGHPDTVTKVVAFPDPDCCGFYKGDVRCYSCQSATYCIGETCYGEGYEEAA